MCIARPPTSKIFTTLLDYKEPSLSLETILSFLDDRIDALIIVVIGLLNILPLPPPIPFLSGIMLLIISIQRCMGYTKLWLPKRIRALSIPKAQLDRILVYTLPICRKLELWTRPRLLFFETKTVRRLIGILLCFLSLNLLCSAPLIGQIPSGIALCVLGFGSVERDGIVLLLGIFLSILSTILTFGFIYAIVTKMLTYLVP